ncbi:MFS multidrug transporter [Colletotrichum karsti]|uniref:MFS multidrug transporter n=1 Tax=Colletotrichum karsti TaxID=1095194 RepID=A0A9P6HWT8_9PEZI|nr:MFS multidrug transporter [Colletotrichum karsti]KAF9871550.1 MFS multidrug transporter [Colletotrichum karsti]
MENPQLPESRQQTAQPLSYPNPSLGDTAGFAATNLSHCVAPSRGQMTPFMKANLVMSLLLGLFLSTLDTSVIATSLISISEEFHDHHNASWVLLAYMLTYMGCSVGIAKLSDIFGRRRMLFFSWVMFIFFSLGCAAADNMRTLITCRAFKGIGGAGLYSLAQICLLEHGPARNPSTMGALIGITLALAFLLGPILGGAITTVISWRVIFALNIPLGALAFLGIYFSYPLERRAHRILSLRTLFRIDFIGMLTLLIASVTLVFAVERGGSRVFEWNSYGIITAFAISGLCWIIFVGWEVYLNKKFCEYPDHLHCIHMEPVFTAALARRRPYICGLIVAFLTGAPYVVLIVAIPERMQVLEHENPFKAGTHLLPMLSGTAMGSFLAGAICRKYNHTAFLMTMASATQLLGVGLMMLVADVDSSFDLGYAFTFVIGLGVGVSFGSSTIVAAVEKDKAVAQGAIAQARVLGSCIGVAICTVLFNSRADSLVHHLSPEQLATLQQEPTASASWSASLVRRVQEVYAVALRDQIIFLTGVCGLMFIVAICSFERDPKPIASLADAQQAFKASQQEDRDGTELSDMSSIRSV